MKTEQLILISELCALYEVEPQFFSNLHEAGLIELWVVKDVSYVHANTVDDLERMVRLHHDLNVNPEGMDVVFNLLERVDMLNTEVIRLKNRLRLYEDFG